MSSQSTSRSWPAGPMIAPAAASSVPGRVGGTAAEDRAVPGRVTLLETVRDKMSTLLHRGGNASESSSSSPAQPARPPLPPVARVYVGAVIALGAFLLATHVPRSIPNPGLSVGLLILSLLGSALKVSLPLPKTAATMSVLYVADFVALLLLGPEQTMLIAGAGAWAQCTFNQRKMSRGLYRTVFSISTLVVTVAATSAAYSYLGGHTGDLDVRNLVRPIVGGAIAYFLVNTVLVATASALATGQSPWRFWHDAFLWSSPSYFVGAGVAVACAWFMHRGELWLAPMAAAPVYLTYRTYKVYLGRFEDERRHVEQISALHAQAMEALDLARRSEQALAAEKEQLAVTLGSIGEAVITSDANGRIVLLNQTAEGFTGWSQAEAVGARIVDVFRLVDRESGRPSESPVDKVLRTQTRVERDPHSALVARDGTQRLVEHSGTPIRGSDGEVQGVVLVVRDITNAVRLEEERLKASKLTSLGVLAGGIAHDFNNILTAILGNISLAQMDAASDAQQSNLTEAERACVRAKALTKQLLTFSKGGAPVKKTVFLRETIREATSFALRGSNVKCEFQLPEGLWAVDADEGQIGQVINNLVINAKQAMPEGGIVTIQAENVPAAADGTGDSHARVRIAISDQGIGIPDEVRAKIFDPYFTTKKTGSGLGLATCYSIVKNHGGHIDVHSVMGRGTTMTISLLAEPVTAKKAVKEAAPAPQRGKGRVLIMDDEEAIRKLATAMLSRLGYRVDVAADGHEAIEKYVQARTDRDPFDTVIMDLTVPGGMGGKDAIKGLMSIDPGVAAIVSSGYADDPVMAEFRDYGFKGVVPKPFSLGELSKVLQQVITDAGHRQRAAA